MRILSTIVGGLGNQLFGYAASLYYAQQWKAPLELLSMPESTTASFGSPRLMQLSHFQIEAKIRVANLMHRVHQTNLRHLKPTVNGLNSALGIVCLPEPKEYTFHAALKPPAGASRIYLRGYWQAYGYVQAMESQLRKDLRFKEEPSGHNRELLDQIRSKNTTISVHIRRGDYLHYGMVLPASYYDSALSHMAERYQDATFVIFSDDMKVASELFSNRYNVILAKGNNAANAFEDMRLMSACTHNIIANSSFSWWGAWINTNATKTVIAPRNWGNRKDQDFSDLFSPQWTLLDN
jgi:hypothetical protein